MRWLAGAGLLAVLAACEVPDGSLRTTSGAVVGSGGAREIAVRDSYIRLPPEARARDTRRVVNASDRYIEVVDLHNGQIEFGILHPGTSFGALNGGAAIGRALTHPWARERGFPRVPTALRQERLATGELVYAVETGSELRCLFGHGTLRSARFDGYGDGDTELRVLLCAAKAQAGADQDGNFALGILRQLRIGEGVNR